MARSPHALECGTTPVPAETVWLPLPKNLFPFIQGRRVSAVRVTH